MSEPPFFDSNVVIYAFTHAGEKTDKARELLSLGGIVSVQVLNETANTLHRKFATGWPRIAEIIESVLEGCPNPLALSLETHRASLRISQRYGFSLYDSLIVASALDAGCTTLYTEDMQHGQIIDGLRIENPFHSMSTP
jgi:predicted nucleic acid-binding protein